MSGHQSTVMPATTLVSTGVRLVHSMFVAFHRLGRSITSSSSIHGTGCSLMSGSSTYDSCRSGSGGGGGEGGSGGGGGLGGSSEPQ